MILEKASFTFLVISILIMSNVYGQGFRVNDQTDKLSACGFDITDGTELSSLVFFKNKFYTVSEKCKTLYVFPQEWNSPVQTIPLNITISSVEGVTTDGSSLLLLDDETGNVEKISIDGKDSGILQFDIKPIKTNGQSGYEGIAYESSNSIIYILKESEMASDNKSYGILYRYKYYKDSLIYLGEDRLILPDSKNIGCKGACRYSDLYLAPNGIKLFLLGSCYNGNMTCGYIHSYMLAPSTGAIRADTYTEVVNCMLKEESTLLKDFSYNVEGMAYDNWGKLYVVTDNNNTKSCRDRIPERKTMLLNIILE